MSFLVVVFGLTLLYWPGFFSAIQNDRCFVWWQTKISAAKILQRLPLLGMIVVLGLPVLAVSCLLSLLDTAMFGLPYLLINVGMLVYAFGRGDSREQVDELVHDLSRGDMQAAYHDLTWFTLDGSEAQATDMAAFCEELKARLAYSFFERHLAVLFWFMVAGAPAALLYRLSVLYRQNVQRTDNTATTGQRWLWLLECLPLRVAGLTLALLGHFDTGVKSWREGLFSGQSSQRALLSLVNAALGFVGRDDPSIDTNENPGVLASGLVRCVEELFFNAIVAWLVVIALVIILG